MSKKYVPLTQYEVSLQGDGMTFQINNGDVVELTIADATNLANHLGVCIRHHLLFPKPEDLLSAGSAYPSHSIEMIQPQGAE